MEAERTRRTERAGEGRCPSCGEASSETRCSHCGAVAAAGGYRVVRSLAQTGHGRVYEAEDVEGRRVALKELVFASAPTEAQIAAFRREADLLRQLQHPAIPRFLGSFEEGAGAARRLYLAQEFVDGVSLAARAESHRFDEAECLRIARELLDVLVYLQGCAPPVVHRDLKPANVLVRSDGSIALVDFGAARDTLVSTLGATVDVGTYAWMPPEQLGGEVGPTTDLYALGAMLVGLLARRPPKELLRRGRRLEGKLSASAPTVAWLERMTAESPDQRFRDAREAKAALDDPALATRATRGRRWRAIRRALSIAALTLLGGIVGVQTIGPGLPWAAWAARVVTQYGPSGHDWRPIHLATEDASDTGDLTKLTQILDSGVAVDTRTGNGVTPLGIAAWHGNMAVVQLLLARHANVNAQDDDSLTPLLLALQQQRDDVATLLVQSGAGVTVGDDQGRTPIWWAASWDDPQLIELLLQHGAAVDAPTADGTTALQAAVARRNHGAIDALLAAGADPLRRAAADAVLDGVGGTIKIPSMNAVDIARTVGDFGLARRLEQVASERAGKP